MVCYCPLETEPVGLVSTDLCFYIYLSMHIRRTFPKMDIRRLDQALCSESLAFCNNLVLSNVGDERKKLFHKKHRKY